jgi:outer membrane protein OmpA-like peptidoglycan-associated protein
MSENPTIKVEIAGHVNGLGKKNKKEFKDLSTSRAQAVQDYLVLNGIPAVNLQVTGYGNAEMLFPEPLNNGQMEANRRVEIRILKD